MTYYYSTYTNNIAHTKLARFYEPIEDDLISAIIQEAFELDIQETFYYKSHAQTYYTLLICTNTTSVRFYNDHIETFGNSKQIKRIPYEQYTTLKDLIEP